MGTMSNPSGTGLVNCVELGHLSTGELSELSINPELTNSSHSAINIQGGEIGYLEDGYLHYITWAHGSESTKSSPLDHQGIPSFEYSVPLIFFSPFFFSLCMTV